MHYHFVGIKGSGMTSLTAIAADRGDGVSGSDVERCIFTQQPLEERHIPVASFSVGNIHGGNTVVVGNAFNESDPEVRKILAMDTVKTYWYHEFLDSPTKEYTSMSVASMRDKTTTTGMFSHVMGLAVPVSYLTGDGTGEMPKDSRYFVLESCEYQHRSLAYKPEHVIITNIESDRIDYYRDMEDYCDVFEAFTNQIQEGVVFLGGDTAMRSPHMKVEHLYYGLKDHNDVQAVYVK